MPAAHAGAKLSHHWIADHPETGQHLQRLVHADKISVIAYGAETVPAVNLGCAESLCILEEFSLTNPGTPRPNCIPKRPAECPHEKLFCSWLPPSFRRPRLPSRPAFPR
jgi:hypothetical protein